jgi:uncharacterized protein
MNLDSLRRALAQRGLTAASVVPDAYSGRTRESGIRRSHLIEGDRVESVPVGAPEPWPEPVAFLDGIQRAEIVAYAGSTPLVAASIAAGVCQRNGRRLQTAIALRREIVLGRPSALALAEDALEGRELVPLPEDDPPHPVRDLQNAALALDRERGALEIRAGDAYRSGSDSWLIVDGSLAESPRWSADPRMLAISRSHLILPFEGGDLERYLRLPVGHRSSLYSPETRSLAPVRAWGLRLWPWQGKDLLYGLVRVEVAPAQGSPAMATRISRWLMAERAPLSAPGPRWDRLLYGIHRVERHLQASGSR